jgi:hypothetical protein
VAEKRFNRRAKQQPIIECRKNHSARTERFNEF